MPRSCLHPFGPLRRRAASVTLSFLVLLLGAAVVTPCRAQTPLLEADRLLAEADGLREALAIQLASLPAADERLAATFNRLCRSAFNESDFSTAEWNGRVGLGIAEAAAPGTPLHARMLDDLGAALRMQRRFDAAAPIVLKALSLRQAQLPGNDPWIAMSLDNLARVLVGRHRDTEALPLVEQAAAIRREVLGERHPLTLESAEMATWLRGQLAPPWARRRIILDAARSLAVLFGALMMLGGTVIWVADGERRASPDRWRWLRGLLIAGAGLTLGWGGAMAVDVAFEAFRLQSPGFAVLAFFGCSFGMIASALLHNAAANRMRDRAGLPRHLLSGDLLVLLCQKKLDAIR